MQSGFKSKMKCLIMSGRIATVFIQENNKIRQFVISASCNGHSSKCQVQLTGRSQSTDRQADASKYCSNAGSAVALMLAIQNCHQFSNEDVEQINYN